MSKAYIDAENELPIELREAFNLLVEDYKTASERHVPGWRGGPSLKILSELIRGGWRKSGKSSDYDTTDNSS